MGRNDVFLREREVCNEQDAVHADSCVLERAPTRSDILGKYALALQMKPGRGAGVA